MPSLLDTRVENTEIVQPNDTNIVDTAHGGTVVKWMDETGGISAIRFAGNVCVTAGMESVDFHHPIHRGDAAVIRSYVYDVGTSSIDVRICVYSENLKTGERQLTTESYFTYVAIDDDGNPVEVPELEVETEKEKELRDEALEGE
ncbi:acyl-CoA thioesterase [Halorutilales archaeon Cl-col2-1]|nr:acyl-CoA thioesterase [Halobacteria archaeon]